MSLLRFLFSISDLTNDFIILVSIIGNFVTIYSFIHETRKKRNRKLVDIMVIILAFIFCMLVLCLGIARRYYVAVPDVVGHEYKNASLELNNMDLLVEQYRGSNLVVAKQVPEAGRIVHRKEYVSLVFEENNENNVIVPSVVGYSYENASLILNQLGLKCTMISKQSPQYIVGQSPEPGTIVDEGTIVGIKTDSIGNRPELIKEWEIANVLEFSSVEMRLKTIEVSVEGFEDGKKEYYGTYLSSFDIRDFYLIEPDSGVEYREYQIKDDVIIMNHVPCGIKFVMHLSVAGYEELEEDIILSKDNMIDGRLLLDQNLTPSDDNMLLNTTFYVKDSNGKAMEGLKICIAWEEENHWTGENYTTTNEGGFKNYIFISRDRTIGVWIINPYGNGTDYECEVKLRYPQIGETRRADVVILNKDGTCTVMSEEEYFE